MDFSSRPPRTRTRAAWKDLAEDLVSDGVRVYQMDCDNKENKKACKLAKVQSYPTIKLCVLLACHELSRMPAVLRVADWTKESTLHAQLQRRRVGRVPRQARQGIDEDVCPQSHVGVRAASSLFILARVRRADASCCRTTVKTLSTEGELLRAVQDDEVVVVLLQPKDAKQDDIVRSTSPLTVARQGCSH